MSLLNIFSHLPPPSPQQLLPPHLSPFSCPQQPGEPGNFKAELKDKKVAHKVQCKPAKPGGGENWGKGMGEEEQQESSIKVGSLQYLDTIPSPVLEVIARVSKVSRYELDFLDFSHFFTVSVFNHLFLPLSPAPVFCLVWYGLVWSNLVSVCHSHHFKGLFQA